VKNFDILFAKFCTAVLSVSIVDILTAFNTSLIVFYPVHFIGIHFFYNYICNKKI